MRQVVNSLVRLTVYHHTWLNITGLNYFAEKSLSVSISCFENNDVNSSETLSIGVNEIT